MKKLVYLLFIGICLTGCKQCKKEQIVVQGYLIDERTGNHFNPFSNATVKLYWERGYFDLVDIGSTTVDGDGFYKIMARHKTNAGARLELSVSEFWKNTIDQKIILSKSVNCDFIIPCSVKLNNVFEKQSGTIIDSIIINVTNSKGNKRYLNLLYGTYRTLSFDLQGEEKNYLELYLYINNGIFMQHYDTVYSGCRTIVNDTIRY